ncbi:MAG: helix-turn-helix domain-containing protein [Candidatus Aenigmatarchaeota archaeon]
MKPVCEIIVQEILPSVRAMVALKLIKSYGLSQEQAAKRMGTTQPAISQYKREIRGHKSNVFRQHPRLSEMVEEIAKKAASGELSPLDVTLEFCRICRYLRSEGIICDLHREINPSLGSCNVCMTTLR